MTTHRFVILDDAAFDAIQAGLECAAGTLAAVKRAAVRDADPLLAGTTESAWKLVASALVTLDAAAADTTVHATTTRMEPLA